MEGLENKIPNKTSESIVFYDVFGKNTPVLSLYKRIEGISGALFLVTNQVKDTEISKNSLREVSLSCLKTSAEILSEKSIKLSSLYAIRSGMTNLHSLLDISFWAGLISQMNVSIIQKEIISTIQYINELEKNISANDSLESNFFKKEPIKDIIKDTIKDNIKDIPTESPVQLKKQVSLGKIDRQEKILSLLKMSQNMSIHEISMNFEGLSEKTVQRELLHMIDRGSIKRVGDRRWSTYSIV
jgi:hypothetical protein